MVVPSFYFAIIISVSHPTSTSWSDLPDEELLEKRICDLQLSIVGSEIELLIQTFYRELDDKRLVYHPPCYLADEWFVLEGSSIIGIPFYLAHPRLKKLEQKMMLEVEGGASSEFMKLLRHEAGHAYFYAYGFNKNPKVRRLFGPSPKEIPESYRPKPYSKSYVKHLENWYAQAEPDEDFAETFAVWMTPAFDWKSYYKGWPALEKLELLDQLLQKISGKTPAQLNIEKSYSAERLTSKLKTYYRRKQKLFAQDYPDFYDRDLTQIFSLDSSGEPAGEFIRKNRKKILDKVTRWTGEKKFIVNNLIKRHIERCQGLKLRLHHSEAETMLELVAYLASMVSNYIYTGKFKPVV